MFAAQGSVSGRLNRNSPSGAHKVLSIQKVIHNSLSVSSYFLLPCLFSAVVEVHLSIFLMQTIVLPFSPSPSTHPPLFSLSLTLSLRCCPQHLRGAVTNCPRKSLSRPHAPPFIFPDSNLLLALLHTCHCVFFLTLESCGKRSVINGVELAGRRSFIMV